MLADGSPASVKPPEAERDALVRDVLAGLDQGQAGRRAVAGLTADGDAVDLGGDRPGIGASAIWAASALITTAS